jgi:hypothetical protein
MAADWTAIEDALFTWVQSASGLAAAKVLWSAQATDVNRPTGQHVEIRIGTDTPLGAAPYVSHEYDEDADAGEEITISVNEVRELVFVVQVFGGATTTSSSSRSVATLIQNALGLPSVRTLLETAGLSPFDRGKIEHVPELLDADFEPRAILEVRFYVADGISEVTGYIDSVEIEDTSAGEFFTVE